tara:strand:+ start:8052 stop:10259 length:2208 start_codon:yes stop_codon:yes gene_type:complete
MKNTNDLLIVEMSSSALSSVQNEEKAYILEGVFGQIDQKNRNNRIYTESEYVPQIEALQQKIEASKLLGELDHPTSFDTSLKNVSHIIEELTYDKDSKEVRGKIRLLDTDAGRQAKALVDAGIPLQISSRAAGAVESNGKVKIKQLFTYDLVADPGFENAELKRVNESYGFDNNSGLWIYEMNTEGQATNELEINKTQIKENKNMAEFVKADDFNKYSEYLANEIKSIKEGIAAKEETSSEDTTVENLTSHNDHIVESVNKLSDYVGYIAEKLDESIQYSEHVAEKTDQSISYSESIAEKLDQGIQYTEHLAEAVSKVKDFSNYLAEAHNEGATTHETLVGYVEYLKENLQSVSEYADYIAESINESVVTEEDEAENPGIEEEDVESAEEITDNEEEGDVKGEEVAKEGDEDAEDAEDVTEVGAEGETKSQDESYSEEEDEQGTEESEEVLKVAESGEGAKDVEEIEDEKVEAGDNSVEGDVSDAGEGKDVEEIDGEEVEAGDNSVEGDVEGEVVAKEGDEDAADAEDVTEVGAEGETKEADAGEGEEEAEGEEGAHDPLESYKNEISSKLDKLVENAQIKENESPSFFKVVSSKTREAYNALNEDAKSNVRQHVAKRGFMTEREILSRINESQLIVENLGAQPTFIALMPSEYAETWANLSEAKQNQITAQSKYKTLNTEYQVANFWQTRDLREAPVKMEKVEMVKESKDVVEKQETLYDVSSYANELKKRFNK